MRAWVISLAGIAAAAAQAAAVVPGDPANGRRLAETWCASCHLVSAEQRTTTEAPPFETLAQRSPDELGWLRAFLADPHPPMPQLSLTRDEIRDLVAYIAALKQETAE